MSVEYSNDLHVQVDSGRISEEASHCRAYGYVFCMPCCNLVAQMSVAKGQRAMSMLADPARYFIISHASQRTEVLCASNPVQTHKLILTELCIWRQPFKHFQPIDEQPFVLIGCNPRDFVFVGPFRTVAIRSRLQNPVNVSLEAAETVDTGSRLQTRQYVPLRDALTMPSPLSIPQMSGKTSKR